MTSEEDILTKEIESWNGFEYSLREENRILFNKMLSSKEQYAGCVNAKGDVRTTKMSLGPIGEGEHGFHEWRQTQTQDAENNVKGNGNYFGVNQEQSSGIGRSYPALMDDNNGNGNGYDSSIQPGQVNPSCKIICLTITK